MSESSSGGRRRLTPEDVRARKRARGAGTAPIVMLTAYDYVSGRVAERAGVDIVLVGDSAAMTVLGYESTRLVSVEEMLMLCRAARRGAPASLMVGDLPFGSYEDADARAVQTARRFMDAGCDAVKIEGAGAIADRARALISAGIPVMGHIGLTPQRTGGPEGFRVQGRTVESALLLFREAAELEDAGCFTIVAEAVPAAVAGLLAPRVGVPVIGIGAGPAVDGQVLVFNDLVGLYDGRTPRFVRRYAELQRDMVAAVSHFAEDVRTHRFPAPEHEYGIDPDELAELARRVEP